MRMQPYARMGVIIGGWVYLTGPPAFATTITGQVQKVRVRPWRPDQCVHG